MNKGERRRREEGRDSDIWENRQKTVMKKRDMGEGKKGKQEEEEAENVKKNEGERGGEEKKGRLVIYEKGIRGREEGDKEAREKRCGRKYG